MSDLKVRPPKMQLWLLRSEVFMLELEPACQQAGFDPLTRNRARRNDFVVGLYWRVE
jgi:hypothetical protein